MVEETKKSTVESQQITSMDQTLAFFDSVFEAVPPLHRNFDRYQDNKYSPKPTSNKKKNREQKKAQATAVSILELNERAVDHVEEIRRANVTKSQAKIKELTAEH